MGVHAPSYMLFPGMASRNKTIRQHCAVCEIFCLTFDFVWSGDRGVIVSVEANGLVVESSYT